MTLRPDPAVRQCCSLLLSTGTAVRLGRAGFGSEEQRLLQTPDLVVLLISYLLKNAPTVGVYVCVFVPFCGSCSSKHFLTYLAKNKMTY